MTLSNADILSIARAQLAVDLNGSPEDFEKDGFVFREARENPGRRPFPREIQHFEMLTMGRGVVVSATPDILPHLQKELEGKTRDEAFSMPFVYGQGLYYLPGTLQSTPLHEDFTLEWVERTDIPKLYVLEGFRYAIQYDENHPRPDALALTAKLGDRVVGIAGASEDCERMWQIGLDVLEGYRGHGLAAALTSRLAVEILRREKVPYYGTSSCNIASQCVAQRVGFRPAWVCVYRGRFDNGLTAPTG